MSLAPVGAKCELTRPYFDSLRSSSQSYWGGRMLRPINIFGPTGTRGNRFLTAVLFSTGCSSNTLNRAYPQPESARTTQYFASPRRVKKSRRGFSRAGVFQLSLRPIQTRRAYIPACEEIDLLNKYLYFDTAIHANALRPSHLLATGFSDP
jgi:hypothetical protein